ncbi:hypothetical protein [Mycobacterium sp. SMC-4]|uniref:hypothetical protein n=1 Tax=Mycobacterium sp. SMC-4 TaxID=2857059 RepID=UPI0021B44E0C|nr:hypothetical protein [Mycobacterium sp. SMC-4]UXA16302.1 hypothetical protein KXD98_15830 [Mycobacterium sp. SMC-4]
MLIGWLSAPRVRLVAFVAGILAALTMVVVGCTHITAGDAAASDSEARQYRSSVSASVAASAASSRAREAQRQEVLRTEAIRLSCEEMSSSSAEAVGAVNTFVDALNTDPPRAGVQVGPAVDALNNSADGVVAAMSEALPADLRDALTSWIEAARGVASAIAGNYPVAEINAAIARLNDSKTLALDRCDAAYR